jgi:hypothetical protein
VSKVWRGRQKDAIEKLHRLHVARRIEPYDEVQPGPGAAVARGTQVNIAHDLCGVAFGGFNHGKAGTVPKKAHQAVAPEGTDQARVEAFGDDVWRGHGRGQEGHAADQVGRARDPTFKGLG